MPPGKSSEFRSRIAKAHALPILGVGLFLASLFNCSAKAGKAPARAAQTPSIRTILESYVQSYARDPMAVTATFGIQIGDEWWHVHAKRHQEPYTYKERFTFHRYGPHEVVLHPGPPEEPTWFFRMPDASTLLRFESGEWNAGTASMRTTPADVVALDDGVMPGFKNSQSVSATVYLVGEHFWKKDEVEITRFARDKSLPTHGASAVSLYTQKDKRIAWFSINKEERVNDDPRLDEGQVPNLLIFTKGRGKAKFADQAMDVKAGMSVFIPPYVRHVIFNPYDEPLEGVLVLFGDNIDFAQGQSYMDFLEAQMQFLERNGASP